MAVRYLNTATGNDINDGLTAGTPWGTLIHALENTRFGDSLQVTPDGATYTTLTMPGPGCIHAGGFAQSGIMYLSGGNPLYATDGILDASGNRFPSGILDNSQVEHPSGTLDNAANWEPCGIVDQAGNFHPTGIVTGNCDYSSLPTQPTCEVGLLKSFALRWAHNALAMSVIPFDRFVTGRIPNISDYPFPYASVICGNPYNRGRSDRSEWYWRVVAMHVWVDAGRLEEDGEYAMELARQIYDNGGWAFNYGRVTDVLSTGHTTAEVNIEEYHYWELIKPMNLRIEQARVDTCDEECPTCSSASSQSSSSCCV